MWIIRLFGCFFVTVSCGILGMKRSAKLYKRVRSVERLVNFVAETGDNIRLCEDEIPEILQRTLPNGITFKNKDICCDPELCLSEKEVRILKEFMKELGMGDIDAQCSRCNLYLGMLSECRKEALCEVNEKSRLFNIGGWMIGLVISFLWW